MSQPDQQGHEAPPAKLNDREIIDDLLYRFDHPSRGYWVAVIVLGAVFVAGLAGFIIRLAGGVSSTPAWGYYATTFAFLLSTVMAVPIVPIGLHFTKALWPRTLNRLAMLYTIPGILWALMFLPLLGTVPPAEGRATMWFEAPLSVMRWVDTIAVFALMLTGLALMYIRCRPDWAAICDQQAGRNWAARLAGGWVGSVRQWSVVQASLTLLGAAYLFLFAFVTIIVSLDFDMSLLPGWRSPIYPAYHILTSLQAAVALTLVTMALARRLGGLERYLRLDQFWALGKLELALSLLWFYFTWSEFIVIWYGRTPRETSLLQALEFGPYMPAFLLAVFLMFALPFVLLIWNHIRKSYLGPPLAGASILVGLFFDRLRLYVPAYAAAGQGGPAAGQVPDVRLPDAADVLIVIGALAGMAFAYLLAMRLVPVISIWETKFYYLLYEVRQFLKATVEVVGKPD